MPENSRVLKGRYGVIARAVMEAIIPRGRAFRGERLRWICFRS